MTVNWPNHPVSCTCVVCNNNVQCNNNQDAMNYCQGILGCQGQDCDGGLFECLTCPSTPTVKFQRSDYSDTVRFVVVLPLS
uniref:Uncharacterized protein n=1 Tax=Acrobeloides nanus TaxID=290746 RepID=A0A914EDR1_9BILA